jgi:hypothetical protein
MPAGSGGAGAGANGFAGAAGVADGAGDGEDICAWALLAKHDPKTTEATKSRKAMVCTRFISSPLEKCSTNFSSSITLVAGLATD